MQIYTLTWKHTRVEYIQTVTTNHLNYKPSKMIVPPVFTEAFEMFFNIYIYIYKKLR